MVGGGGRGEKGIVEKIEKQWMYEEGHITRKQGKE